jgi:hypothetical protein
VLKYVPKGEDRPRIAIETAEAWTRGETTLKQVESAAHDAYDAHAAHAAYDALAVDGGKDYLRRLFNEAEDYEELSETEEDNEKD